MTKFCSTCGAVCVEAANFCGQCGAQFISLPREGASVSATRKAFKQPGHLTEINKAESAQALLALRRSKQQGCFILGAIGLFGAVGLGVLVNEFVGLIVLVLTVIAVSWKWRTKKVDYYSLPHSKDEHGAHRCIFCGGRGIWRSTPYGTNSTRCRCSKCQEDLYIE